MSVIDQNLLKDEKVVYRTRYHVATLFLQPGSLLIATITIALALPEVYTALTVIVGALLTITSFLNGLASFLSFEAVLTSRRVLTKSGLLSTKCNEILFTKVEAIDVNQHILARILGFGNLVITGTGGSKNTILNIPAPFVFRRYLQEQVSEIHSPAAPTLAA